MGTKLDSPRLKAIYFNGNPICPQAERRAERVNIFSTLKGVGVKSFCIVHLAVKQISVNVV